jgi:hypothetical protein
MDLATWSPFQSPQVREICTHMTATERRAVMSHGGLYGVWTALTVVAPIAALRNSDDWRIWAIALAVIGLHVGSIPAWQRRARRLLCSTEWAKQTGVTPDLLPLFAFRRRAV